MKPWMYTLPWLTSKHIQYTWGLSDDETWQRKSKIWIWDDMGQRPGTSQNSWWSVPIFWRFGFPVSASVHVGLPCLWVPFWSQSHMDYWLWRTWNHPQNWGQICFEPIPFMVTWTPNSIENIYISLLVIIVGHTTWFDRDYEIIWANPQ